LALHRAIPGHFAYTTLVQSFLAAAIAHTTLGRFVPVSRRYAHNLISSGEFLSHESTIFVDPLLIDEAISAKIFFYF
jgi:hypothetical protein